MSKPVLLAAVGDVHAGSTVAVCPPRIEMDDGGCYESTKVQGWLWQNWGEWWAAVEKRRAECRADLYVVINGDLTEGNHHGTTQILSGNPTAQSMVVDALLEPMIELKPKKIFVVRGTSAHVGKSAAFEERVALGLWKDKRPVQKDPDTGRASWWSLKMEIQDVLLSFKHHGRMGQRPWTKRNITQLLAFQIYTEHVTRGWRHPDVAFRSHLHTYDDTGKSRHCPTRLVAMPAWQIHTEYAHQAVTENVADIGGVMALIEAGDCQIEPMIFEPRPEPVWRV